ncbi:hypothetical protein [Sneathiella aquimaris]|uniref:hypothetical protein n=1 Tax=Sneathiella aquimaris TaxID=2599305 RepID=UPI00146DF1F9|nr:hypothetical protein [Sneathiella aquimaris]
MQIEPYILIPAAALAVLIMIGLIRLISGSKNLLLSEKAIRTHLRFEQPDLEIQSILVSTDKHAALVVPVQDKTLRLVRSFGNKIVMQMVERDGLHLTAASPTTTLIDRQDWGHPALKLSFEEKTIQSLKKLLLEEQSHVSP